MARQAFDKSTTGTEVAECFSDRIRGKTILVTGPSPGSIGEATVLALARDSPALLLLASRSQAKLDAVAASCREILAATDASNQEPGKGKPPSTGVKTVVLDLLSLDSVRSAAAEITRLTDHLDILINNAGISTNKLRYSAVEIESQFATNHLGHFLLTSLLLPLMLHASPGARIVNVSSRAHRLSPVRFSDINFEDEVGGPKRGTIGVPKEEQFPPKVPTWTTARASDGFPGFIAYGQSKTANILFTVELKRRLKDKGVDSFAVHPGEIMSNLANPDELSPEAMEAMRSWPDDMMKTPDQGCATTLVAALDPEIPGPEHIYFSDCQIAHPAPWAVHPNHAERLWRLSEQLVGGSPEAGCRL
ncbi:unnamed protein product [Discula destructiva]